MAKENRKKKTALSGYDMHNAANARTQQKGRGRRAVSFARGAGREGLIVEHRIR